MLRLAARLPDPLIGFAPACDGALRLRLDDRPEPPREALAAAGVKQHGVQRRAVDVVLPLIECAVPDPHGTGAGVSREVVTRGLGQITTPVDPVHDLQRSILVELEVGDELHELVRLPVQVEEMKRLQGEGGVADPGVAVVPVALAARGLRQRRGQRRDGRPGRHVGEALDRQRRALDRLPPAVVDHRAPASQSRQNSWSRRSGRWRHRGHSATRGPRPTRASSRAWSPACRVCRALTELPSMPEVHVGLQPDGLAGAAGVGGMAVLPDRATTWPGCWP